MARPLQENLKYFSFDVDFFEDRKIKALKGKYGVVGISAYIYLLCQIYKESYYIEVDEDFILCMSGDLNISEDATRQILKYLFSRSLLCEIKDSTPANPVTIVTAKSIQRRYQEAKNDGKRKKGYREIFVKAKYWMLEISETYSFIKICPDDNKSPINSDKFKNNSNKSPINGTKESKGNKNKSNQMKTNESKSAEGGLPDDSQKEIDDDLAYRQTLVEAYGEELIRRYELRFDHWANGKKVNVNKYEAIDQWLVEDLN